MTTNQYRFRNFRTLLLAICCSIAFYVGTVGITSAISRHMEDGYLQWMQSSEIALAMMQFYEWPAKQLTVVPGAHWFFELSAAFWCGITDAPETTA